MKVWVQCSACDWREACCTHGRELTSRAPALCCHGLLPQLLNSVTSRSQLHLLLPADTFGTSLRTSPQSRRALACATQLYIPPAAACLSPLPLLPPALVTRRLASTAVCLRWASWSQTLSQCPCSPPAVIDGAQPKQGGRARYGRQVHGRSISQHRVARDMTPGHTRRGQDSYMCWHCTCGATSAKRTTIISLSLQALMPINRPEVHRCMCFSYQHCEVLQTSTQQCTSILKTAMCL
jgi:hypothetical protein